ncbi:hypothetical protein C8J30_104133 [Rhodobacter viridis]|uniref:Lipoprotein n=1 Tax=Rhodobacter viridis TaxID=1054202 RepID=A0A318TZJ2_9RHOB|nr:hypothetical protein [Rhodobacter viridis]PYF10654.1 hypothetical protein C8J30_104133 [Rhodobacter viridis]
MVGASKILTVSYGTFSCTLEGFDEPFTTMKAIAEYFRDLAAEDRYFGAEPPQPDAEMLHRIAEREMARRVEAKIQKNGVILRPSDPAAPEQAEPAPAAVATPAVALATVPNTAPVATAPVAPPVATPRVEPASDPISESVAAKLQRIRSAVAQARAAQAPAEPEPDPEPELRAPAEQVAAAPEDFGFALDISGPLSPDEAEDIETDQAPETPSSDAPALEDTAPEERAPDHEADDEDEATVSGMDPEKAERMRRRAERRAARLVQAEPAAPVADANVAPVEAAAAESAAEPEAPVPAPMPAPVEPVAEATEQPAPVETPRPVIRARVIKLRRSDAAADGPRVAERVVEVALPEVATASVTEPEAEPVAEATAADDELAQMIAAVSATVAEAPAPESDAAAEEAPGLSPEAEAELMAELAALTDNLGDVDWGIEGWSNESTTTGIEAEGVEATAAAAVEADPDAEAEAGIEALVVDLDPEPEDLTEESLAESVAPEAVPPTTPTIDLDTLFAEDEPEPTAVAAFLPEELPPGFVDRRTQPTEPILVPVRPTSKVPPLPEGDLPRLLEKADAQMAGNENRRRISAIAHLKAAVAATVAERRVAGDGVEKDETAPYRQDLTQAVRPRRPVLPSVGESHHQTAARPEVRPAPLVLVSEQRVDRAPAEAVAKAQAVRPRRISAASLAQDTASDSLTEDEVEVPLSPEEASSFAEFAQSRSPQGLAELLEAAAAYTAQVEGRPHFSPPQIMSKVSAIGDGSFSREDRLRMFGTLLRQGKIAKVKRGQYAITEASRFFKARA